MSAQLPHVSVFHLTHRISKNKIRKYKLATERGMAMTTVAAKSKGQVKSDTSKTQRNSAANAVADTSMDPPPAKKPRLRLKPPKPVQSVDVDDTIAVSRPKREASIKFRYSQEMNIKQDADDTSPDDRVKPSSIESQTLSSFSPAPDSASKLSSMDQSSQADVSMQNYGNLMSYYIAGGEDETVKKPKVKPKVKSQAKSKSTSLKLPRSQQKEPLSRTGEPTEELVVEQTRPESKVVEPSQHKEMHRSGRRKQPNSKNSRSLPLSTQDVAAHRSGPPTVIQRPSFHFIDIDPEPKPSKPVTVAETVQRLNELSLALSSFTNLPPPPDSPSIAPEKPFEAGVDNVDAFLSHFGPEEPEVKQSDQLLSVEGVPDENLLYGINFIQSALRSWAAQRLTSEFMANFHADLQRQMQRRDGFLQDPSQSELADDIAEEELVVRLDVASTPEGAAIKAFQHVLNTGCIRTNVILPHELSRPLRRIYVQIDQMINQTPKNEEPWQCMSYGAQIAADKARYEAWSQAHAAAQAELTRQYQVAEQQGLGRMGFAGPHQIPVNLAPAQDDYGTNFNRRKSMSQASRPLSSSQQSLVRMQSGFQPSEAQRSTKGFSSTKAESRLLHPGSHRRHSHESAPTRHCANSASLADTNFYAPAFLPRSGQSMEFSFTPQSQAAAMVLGSHSYPEDLTSSIVRSRRHLNTAPKQPRLANQPGDTSESPMEIPSSSPVLGHQLWNRAPPAQPDSASARIDLLKVKSSIPEKVSSTERKRTQSPSLAGNEGPCATMAPRPEPTNASVPINSFGLIAVDSLPSSTQVKAISATSPDSIASQESTIEVALSKSFVPMSSTRSKRGPIRGRKSRNSMPSRSDTILID